MRCSCTKKKKNVYRVSESKRASRVAIILLVGWIDDHLGFDRRQSRTNHRQFDPNITNRNLVSTYANNQARPYTFYTCKRNNVLIIDHFRVEKYCCVSVGVAAVWFGIGLPVLSRVIGSRVPKGTEACVDISQTNRACHQRLGYCSFQTFTASSRSEILGWCIDRCNRMESLPRDIPSSGRWNGRGREDHRRDNRRRKTSHDDCNGRRHRSVQEFH